MGIFPMANRQIPEAVIEVISKKYEAKDLKSHHLSISQTA